MIADAISSPTLVHDIASTATNVTRKLLFLGLARNCERTLPTFFRYLNELREQGHNCGAVIGENGSKDRTRMLIAQAIDHDVALVDTALMGQVTDRLARMAVGREALFNAAHERSAAYDYVCVADLDNVMSEPPSEIAVRSAIMRLQSDKSLFAVGATSRPFYYDLLSLRTDGHDYSRLSAEIEAAKKKPLKYFRFHQQRIYENQKLMTRVQPIVCTSSFNGFCVYNAADYRLGSYRAPDEANVCEHVTFNMSICRATGKRMLIAPELVIRMPGDHGPVGFLRFWYDRIKKASDRFGMPQELPSHETVDRMNVDLT